MYQLLENDAWVITDNCTELIECLPQLVRDDRRIEDIRKMDGDDPADAARYGLVAAARFGGSMNFPVPVIPSGGPSGFGGPQSRLARRGGDLSSIAASSPRFTTGMPLGEQIARRITATDPTSVAIHSQRLESEARKQFRPAPLLRRRRW